MRFTAAWRTLTAHVGPRSLLRRLALVAVVSASAGGAAGAAHDQTRSAYGPSPSPRARALAQASISDASVPRFADVTRAAGVDVVQRAHGCSGNVSGAAWADFDGDGRLDLYLPESGGPGRLFWGRTPGRFAAAAPSRWGLAAIPGATAAVAADFDSDGRPDLYVVAQGRNRLFHNIGHGRFRDVTDTSGTGDTGAGTAAAWADFNHDGRLDLYVVNGDNCRAPRAAPDRLYENRIGGRFADVTRMLERGAATTRGVGLQAAWVDGDGDGDPDLYVANDDLGFGANQLWRNDGPGRGGWRFTAAPTSLRAGVAMSSMGIGAGDLNGDGRPDLVISDLRRPPLVLLGGGRGFRLRRLPPATSDRAPIGWGTVVGDFNNDGHADVLVAGGDLGLGRSDPAQPAVPRRRTRRLPRGRPLAPASERAAGDVAWPSPTSMPTAGSTS